MYADNYHIKMTKQEAITKAKKIKALADRGSTIGEREVAQHKLQEFMKIHNLTDQDLDVRHSFSYRAPETEFSNEFFERVKRDKEQRQKRREARKEYRNQRSSHRQNRSTQEVEIDPEVIELLRKLGEIIFNAYRRR